MRRQRTLKQAAHTDTTVLSVVKSYVFKESFYFEPVATKIICFSYCSSKKATPHCDMFTWKESLVKMLTIFTCLLTQIAGSKWASDMSCLSVNFPPPRTSKKHVTLLQSSTAFNTCNSIVSKSDWLFSLCPSLHFPCHIKVTGGSTAM